MPQGPACQLPAGVQDIAGGKPHIDTFLLLRERAKDCLETVLACLPRPRDSWFSSVSQGVRRQYPSFSLLDAFFLSFLISFELSPSGFSHLLFADFRLTSRPAAVVLMILASKVMLACLLRILYLLYFMFFCNACCSVACDMYIYTRIPAAELVHWFYVYCCEYPVRCTGVHNNGDMQCNTNYSVMFGFWNMIKLCCVCFGFIFDL